MLTVQRGFFAPLMLLVVSIAGLTSVSSAWWSSRLIAAREAEHLEKIVAALRNRAFPLTSAVLDRMSLLSGVQFAILDDRGQLQTTTLEGLHPGDLATIGEPSASGTRLPVNGVEYDIREVEITPEANRSPGRLWVMQPQAPWWSRHRQAIAAGLGIGAASCLVLALLVALVARRVVRPLKQLAGLMPRIAAGDFTRLDVPCQIREIHELIDAFNAMLETLGRYEAAVRRGERLKTLGQLSGSMAHQLRNAATGARIALDLHRREAGPECDAESLGIAHQQLANIELFLQRLLLLGAPRPSTGPSAGPVPLADVVCNARQFVEPLARHNRVELREALPAKVSVAGPTDDLEQILISLLTNAIEAARHAAGERPIVELRVVAGESESLAIEVRDTGPGPGSEVAGRLFEPFVTDKPAGSGLGLALAREMIATRGGSLHWRRDGTWTCFTIELPLSMPQESTHALVGR